MTIHYYGYELLTTPTELQRIITALEIPAEIHSHIRSPIFTVHRYFTDQERVYEERKTFDLDQLEAKHWIQKRQQPREAIIRAKYCKGTNVVAEILVDGTPYYVTIVFSGMGSLHDLKKKVNSGSYGPRIVLKETMKVMVKAMFKEFF